MRFWVDGIWVVCRRANLLLFWYVCLIAVASASAQNSGTNCDKNQFTIEPKEARIAPGGTLRLEAKPANSNCALTKLSWDVKPHWDRIELDSEEGSTSADLRLKGTVPEVTRDLDQDSTRKYIRVIASAGDSSGNDGTKQVAEATVLVTVQPGGNIVIPVIGFEQAGASSAQSRQKFFFNFFISRPLPLGNSGFRSGGDVARQLFGPTLRWWGDVRIASYPQQISTGVAEFAAGFAGQVAQLQVNKLAQAGEFNTGLDFRIASFPHGLYPVGGSRGSEHSLLSLVAGVGAISPLSPTESLQIFVTPPVGSAQRAPFLARFPTSANFTYTGFTTPDRDKFFWEYGAGVRLTTLFLDNSGLQGGSPAMVTYSLGQNQLVSGGFSRGIVQKIEAFFPLPLGERFARDVTTVYLFGRADMRLAAPHQDTPFILQPAPSTVNGFDPNVNIVSFPSNRDVYTIGVGADAVKLIKTIARQNGGKSTSKAVKEVSRQHNN